MEPTHPVLAFLQDIAADDTLPIEVRERAEELLDRYENDIQEIIQA